jgi:mannose-6-phosphate isomerase-like protein (cupin superfamily)
VNYQAINLADKFGQFTDQWSPKVIAAMNDYQFKLSRLEGEFVWHAHVDTDEVFFLIEGELTLEFRDGQVDLKAGDLFVVPKGVEHRPIAKAECKVMIVEPRGVVNTGDASAERAAENDVWI